MSGVCGPFAVEVCPVCGKRLRVVFEKPWSIVKGVEVVDES